MIDRRLLASAGLVVMVLAACTEEPDPPASPDPPPVHDEDDDPEPPPPENGEDEEDEEDDTPDAHGISAGHPDAVEAGMTVLEQGGSAVEAAVAAAFASGVSEPFTSGMGGGGAAVVLSPGEEPQAYDYREVVPDAGVPVSNTGVPGFVAGMERLHGDHGELDFADVLDPAIELAAEGTAVSGLVGERLAGDAGALPTGQLDHLFPGGAALSAGETMVQDELADTMRTLADAGPRELYEGDLATSLAETVDGLDSASLADYEVQSSTPPSGAVGSFEVFGAAPPLGGTSLVQTLQIAEAAGVGDHGPDTADFVHVLGSAWRIALAHQEWDLGDPEFVDVPVDELVDAERNATLADDIDLGALPSVDLDQPRGGTDPNTTHITAVDGDGTMVSMTNTITNFWGSRQYAHGFFLNDHLSRFDLGRGEANQPEPGKRPVTWSLPAVVADEDGRPVLGLGTPGGPRIPGALAGAIARWALHDQSLDEVVAAPRLHVTGTALEVEDGLLGLEGDLVSRGWGQVTGPPSRLHFGSIQALEVDYDTGEVHGATDERREADHRIEPALE